MKHQVFDLAELDRKAFERKKQERLAKERQAQQRLEQERALQAANQSDSPLADAQSIRESVAAAMDTYFKDLDGQKAVDVYQMVLAEVEEPLLKAVMQYTRKNQTKASNILGLNRGTLRKKLKQYGML
ncbi:MAG: DNA-binding transcriptional regulator Fis [Pseudomonadales bacterium]|nr:DNA-binding transcriptional regulator Fis [Pseudomonadales bacterium]